MTKDNFYDRAGNGNDLSSFEQQLRSFEPVPPKADLEDLLQVPEREVISALSDSASVFGRAPRLTGGWLSLGTHVAATVIGIGVGAVWVAMFSPQTATSLPVSTQSSQQKSNEQDQPVVAPPVSFGQEQMASREDSERPKSPNRIEFENRNAGSWPLTPMTRFIETEPWPRVRNDVQPVSFDEPAVRSEPHSMDRPMSSPELMRVILGEQAQFSEQRGRDVG